MNDTTIHLPPGLTHTKLGGDPTGTPLDIGYLTKAEVQSILSKPSCIGWGWDPDSSTLTIHLTPQKAESQ
jgi:hypothetical protein